MSRKKPAERDKSRRGARPDPSPGSTKDLQEAGSLVCQAARAQDGGLIRVSCGALPLEQAALLGGREHGLISLFLDPAQIPPTDPHTFTPLLDAWLRCEARGALTMPSQASVRRLCLERDLDALPVYLSWLRRLNQRGVMLLVPQASSQVTALDDLLTALVDRLPEGCSVVVDVDVDDNEAETGPYTLDLGADPRLTVAAPPPLAEPSGLSEEMMMMLALHAVSPGPLPYGTLQDVLGAEAILSLPEAAPWVRADEKRSTSIWVDPSSRRAFRDHNPTLSELACRMLGDAVLDCLRTSIPHTLPPLENLFKWLTLGKSASLPRIFEASRGLEQHIDRLRVAGALHRALPAARAWQRFLTSATSEPPLDVGLHLEATARAALSVARVEADVAHLHEAQRHLGEAARAFSRLFAESASADILKVLAEAWHQRARLLLELDEPAAAATLTAGALKWLGGQTVEDLEIVAEVAGLHRCHGLALHDIGQSDEARESLEIALGLLHHCKPEALEGLPEWCRTVARAHSDLASVTRDLGLCDEERGHYTTAKQRLREALSVDATPATRLDLALVLYGLGCAEDAMGDDERARHDLEKCETFLLSLISSGWALELRDVLADVSSRLASLALADGRLDESLVHLEREATLRGELVEEEGVARIPALANALNDTGVVLLRAGRTDEAVAQFSSALDVFLTVPEDSRNLDWRADVAAIHGNLGKAHGEGEKAMQSFQRALDIYAEMDESEAEKRRAVRTFVHLSRAELHLKSERWEDALADFEACQRLHEVEEQSPEPASAVERLDVLLARLEVLRRLHRHDQVQEGYGAAATLFEQIEAAKRPSLLRRMARLHAAVGEYALETDAPDLAIAALSQAARCWRNLPLSTVSHRHRVARINLLLARSLARTQASMQQAMEACEEALLRFRDIEDEPTCAIDHAEAFCEWADRHLESGHIDVAMQACDQVFKRLEGVGGDEAAAMRARAYVLRGTCHAVEGLNGEAADDLHAAEIEVKDLGTLDSERMASAATALLALLTETQSPVLANATDIPASLARGRALERDGNFAESLETYGNAIAHVRAGAPRRSRPWADLTHLLRLRAGLLLRTNDIPRALHDCESGLAIISSIPRGERGRAWSLEEARFLALRGDLHLRLGEVDGALTDLRGAAEACLRSTARTARAERVDMLALLAEGLQTAGDASAALRAWDEAQALVDTPSEEISSGRGGPVPPLHAWWRLATAAASLQATGRAAQARARAFAALDETTGDLDENEMATVLVERARERAKRGEIPEALQDCARAAAHGSHWRERDAVRWGRLLALRGRLHAVNGATAAALADLKAAREAWETAPSTLTEQAVLRSNLGLVLLVAGQPTEARAEIQTACNLMREARDANTLGDGTTGPPPHLAIALHNLARVQAAVADWEGARRSLTTSIPFQRAAVGRDRPERLEPLAAMLHDRGIVHANLGMTPEALADLDAAVEVHRRLRGPGGAMGLDEAEALLYRACVSQTLRDEADVLADLSEALLTLRRLSSRDARAREALGRVLPTLGRLLLSPMGPDASATA